MTKMPNRILALLIPAAFFVIAVFAIGCSAQTEEQALATLRTAANSGRMPSEEVVTGVERRFAGKRAGALAKLLRAQIKFENKDYAGAAALLNSEEFKTLTRVADHALWLRGSALQKSGDHTGAMDVFSRVVKEYPDSIRARDAKLKWAESATSAGRGMMVPAMLDDLNQAHAAAALLLTAKSYEASGDQPNAIKFYRQTYFYGAGSDAAKEAEAKLTSLAQSLAPQNAEEARVRAEKLFATKNYTEADKAYTELAIAYPTSADTNLGRLKVLAILRKGPEAQSVFNAIPASAKEKEEAYYQLTLAYSRAKLWPNARQTAEEMRQKFPQGELTPKAWVDAGMAARDAKNKLEEQYFLRAAVANFPKAVEVAGAQFELAWLEHEARDFAQSSQMLTEHLARYVDKDNSNRGKAGYWAARDSERAGKTDEACALYDAVIYRYSANWYGYMAQQRLTAMKSQGKCKSPAAFPAGSIIPRAVANLKTVTVAPETSTAKELARADKSADLSAVGLYEWAIDELEEAKKTAQNSPKINLALAKHYRLRGDNVNALLALARSYPDYSQMFPEEMGREEWDIFYPLTHWNEIKHWAKQRDLDHYQVAGLIRQESVFNPRARSHANAYGLMQLLVPTARSMARKYVATTASVTSDALYQAPLNIELGTAYMRDQFDKFGRIEYVAIAYNAGPGRVNPWRASLPAEMDEFVEEIPFRETKGYVQGVIRNAAQYRRLYDEDGKFKPNVGTKPLRGEIDSKSKDQIAQEFPDVVVGATAISD